MIKAKQTIAFWLNEIIFPEIFDILHCIPIDRMNASNYDTMGTINRNAMFATRKMKWNELRTLVIFKISKITRAEEADKDNKFLVAASCCWQIFDCFGFKWQLATNLVA